MAEPHIIEEYREIEEFRRKIRAEDIDYLTYTNLLKSALQEGVRLGSLIAHHKARHIFGVEAYAQWEGAYGKDSEFTLWKTIKAQLFAQ